MAVAAISFSTPPRPLAQDDAPVFRVETRVVEVDAYVTDGNGTFVSDLTAADFQILEDGVPHEVAQLSVVTLPVDRRGRPQAPDVEAVADTPPSAGFDRLPDIDDVGRLYVMILDSGPADRVRSVARLFIEEFMGPTDLLAVVHTTESSGGPPQGLTNDRAALLAAVERYRGSSTHASLASFQLLKDVAVHLNAVAGRRKSVLFISGGAPRGLLWLDDPRRWASDDAERRRDAWRLLNDALETAARNNVRIHTVEPSGLPAVGGDLTTESGTFVEDGQSRLERLAAGMYATDSGASLRLIADDSGGRAIVNTNNFAGGFGRIVREQSAYYVLGYYSNAPRDGAYRQIAVRVARHGVSVRSRSGYRALLPDVPGPAVSLPRTLSAAARDILRGNVAAPATDLRVDLSTTVFRGEAFDGSVLVDARVAGRDLSLGAGERLELAYAAIDRWGRVRAVGRHAFTVHPEPSTHARLADTGVRFLGRLTVPAGRYEIRLAVHQPGGGRGSASTHVDVPHFAELSLSVSDLVVASSAGDASLTLTDDDRVRRMLPAPPTAARRFAESDTLAIFAEIYDSHWLLASEVGVTGTIARNDGTIVHRNEQTLTATDGGVFFYTGVADLRAFGPGAYVLTVEAHTMAGIPAAGSRQLRFDVTDENRIVGSADGIRPSPWASPRAFEFVSITRNDTVRERHAVRVLPGGRFEARRTQLLGLVRLAYGLEELDQRLIAGEQRWMSAEYFDVVAVSGREWSVPPGGTYPPELRPMLRALLAERFGVETRTESREIRARILRMAGESGELGPGIRPSRDRCLGPYAEVPSDSGAAMERCPFRLDRTAPTGGIEAGSVTMADLARLLSELLSDGDLVVDGTGLAGTFDVTLTFEASTEPGAGLRRLAAAGLAVPTTGLPVPVQDIQTALHQQLGLRLEPTHASVERLVVERARRPFED